MDTSFSDIGTLLLCVTYRVLKCVGVANHDLASLITLLDIDKAQITIDSDAYFNIVLNPNFLLPDKTVRSDAAAELDRLTRNSMAKKAAGLDSLNKSSSEC